MSAPAFVSYYQRVIRETLDAHGLHDVDARQVEAWMRLEAGAGCGFGCLDGWSRERFDREALEAAAVVLAYRAESAELAEDFGL